MERLKPGKTPLLEKKESDEARLLLRQSQETVNRLATDVANQDDLIEEIETDLAFHQKSFFWFKEVEAGEVPMYYLLIVLMSLVPALDIFFVGREATGSFFLAFSAPIGLTILLVGLLTVIERKKLSLAGGKIPQEKEIDKGELKLFTWPLKEVPVLLAFKWFVISLFAFWAFFVMSNSELNLIRLNNELAQANALISGGIADVQGLPSRWAIVLEKPMIAFYTAIVFIGHTVLSALSEYIFETITFFGPGGYSRKYKRFRGQLRKLKRERRRLIDSLANRYTKYKSDLADADNRFEDFRKPDEIITNLARSYLEEHMAGYKSSEDDDLAMEPYVPEGPDTPIDGGAVNTNGQSRTSV